MKFFLTIILLFTVYNPLISQNKPEHEQWLLDAGFGMFIHWSMDSQLGIVISHSTVGASEDYANRYFNELPKTFNPAESKDLSLQFPEIKDTLINQMNIWIESCKQSNEGHEDH